MQYKVVTVDVPQSSIIDIPDGCTPLGVLYTGQLWRFIYLIPLSEVGLGGRKLAEPGEGGEDVSTEP